jgi:twitching motility protein PilT
MRTAEVNALLRLLVESGEGVSDLNFTPGKPPQIEAEGELRFPFVDPPLPELSPFMTEQIALCLLENRPGLIKRLLQTGSCDFAFAVPGLSRFRVNVFSQRGAYSIVLRRLATTIPTIHDLVLPPVFEKLAGLRDGLILITGGPGSGKTTTMSSLAHQVNLTRPVHIVTLEDPIEFLHRHQLGTVNQRELGFDFDTFANGVRAALRQAPKVIVVGELRDRETVEVTLSAAETGHLVLSTMQTISAGQTVERLATMFPAAEQQRIRTRLAGCLRYIVAQCLVPKKDGGRIAALEILAPTMRAQELIRTGETEEKTFYKIISEGRGSGMQTFDQHLLRLFEEGWITEDTFRHYSTGRVEIMRQFERVRHALATAPAPVPAAPAAPAASEIDISDLKMDYTWGRKRDDDD